MARSLLHRFSTLLAMASGTVATVLLVSKIFGAFTRPAYLSRLY